MKNYPRFFRYSLISTVLFALSAGADSVGDVRIALVIGNATYANAPLANPINDARAMGETLRNLGFTVVELRDGSKVQMSTAVNKVRDALQGKKGIGLLYYAGHGLQMDARNYMLPVDAKIRTADDISKAAIDVNSVVDAFKSAGNRMNILVLDACRNNPFGGIASGKGLAPMDAPSGTFFAYATAPGNVAGDGDEKSGNGLYTQYLLKELKRPQARIEDVFKRVRFAVRKDSNGQQIPWESTSLEDDFLFNEGRVIPIAKPTMQQLQADFSQEKQDWERISQSTNVDDFYAFLQKYPSGTIAEAAHARLNELAKSKLVVQGGGADGRDMLMQRERFRLGDTFSKQRSMIGTPNLPTEPQTDTYKVTSMDGNEVLLETRISLGKGMAPVVVKKYYTAEGAFLGVGEARLDPPMFDGPSGLLQVGQVWRIAFQTRTSAAGVIASNVIEGRVLGREKITVAAGSFDTFKMSSINYFDNDKGTLNCTLWVSPALPTLVRTACEMSKGGKQLWSASEELASFVRGAAGS